MSNWWDNMTEDDWKELSPEDQALTRKEIEYHQVVEEEETVLQSELAFILQQAKRNRDGMNDAIEKDKMEKIEAAKARMEAVTAKKQRVWAEWVCMKPYMAEAVKKDLREKYLK
jgi:hypothetical protein